jgi:MFS family permease
MHGVPACLLVYFLAGICAGSALVSHYNMVFETCPHENRGAHITLANLVIGGFTALTPIVAGVAAAHWGSHAVFAASLLLSVCALAWFLLRVREPRKRNSGRLAKIASYD